MGLHRCHRRSGRQEDRTYREGLTYYSPKYRSTSKLFTASTALNESVVYTSSTASITVPLLNMPWLTIKFTLSAPFSFNIFAVPANVPPPSQMSSTIKQVCPLSCSAVVLKLVSAPVFTSRSFIHSTTLSTSRNCASLWIFFKAPASGETRQYCVAG